MSEVYVTAPGGMTFHLIYDAAADAAGPDAAIFRKNVETAAMMLSQSIQNQITVNIKIDYSGTGGKASASPSVGVNNFVSYEPIKAADLGAIVGAVAGTVVAPAVGTLIGGFLGGAVGDLLDLTGLTDDLLPDNFRQNLAQDLMNSSGSNLAAGLPTGTLIQGSPFVEVSNAQLKMFGLMNANDTASDDGSATFSTDWPVDEQVGTALHELAHVLGRVPFGPVPNAFDLFRFSSPGNRVFDLSNNPSTTDPVAPAYFSLDGGVTKLADYGTTSDASDFSNTGVQGGTDPFDESQDDKTLSQSTLQQLTFVDLTQLEAIGFKTRVPTAPHLKFNIIYDPSVTGAPPAFKQAIEAVAKKFEGLILDPITINLTISYGAVAAGAYSQNLTTASSFTYDQIRAALANDATSASDRAAALPALDPLSGSHTYMLTTAQQKALGLLDAGAPLQDGAIVFSNTETFDFDPSNGISVAASDFMGLVAKEFSAVMGRSLDLGATDNGVANAYKLLDLYNYSASGVRTTDAAGYFSIDGGQTNLNTFSPAPGGAGDWSPATEPDAFRATGQSGVQPVTPVDLRELDVLGYDSLSDVSTAGELSTDLKKISDASRATGGDGTHYVITLAQGATLTESSNLNALTLYGDDTLTIDGNGATLDGAGSFQGIFVRSGDVTIDNLTIAHTLAIGGAGQNGGGGGAGLGGGLLVLSGGPSPSRGAPSPSHVTLDNVIFSADSAIGGAGASSLIQGGYVGGGVGGGLNGLDGGGIAGLPSRSGGGGGFGGGGGAAGFSSFLPSNGGQGGWGGGGGSGNLAFIDTNAGFGAGSGIFGGGGGGLGAGGGLFVQKGASITINGGSISGGTVFAGNGGEGNNGSAYGAGIFLQGNQSLTFAPAAGQKTTISDIVADEAGSNGGGVGATGKGTLILDGPGTLDLSGANTFEGGVTIDQGTLELGNAYGAGYFGNIDFTPNGGGTLLIDANLSSNSINSIYSYINSFDALDSFDFAGFDPAQTHATFYTFANRSLIVTSGTKDDVLNFSYSLNFTGQRFYVASDGSGGSIVSLRPPPNHAPVGTDNTISLDENGSHVFSLADFGFSDPNDSPGNSLKAVHIDFRSGGATLTDKGSEIPTLNSISAADIAAGDLVYTPTTLSFGAPYDHFTFRVQDTGGTAYGGVDTDPTARTMTIDVNQVVHQPQFASGATDASLFLLGGAPDVVAPNLVVADAIDPDLTQATVSIASGLAAGDLLTIDGATSGVLGAISFAYDSTAGVLTLSGADTIADYQSALRLVAYSSNATLPPANAAASRGFSLTATSADPLAAVSSLVSGPTVTLAIDVAYFLAHKASLDALPSFTVYDSWSNVAAHLDALNDDNSVASIKLTDAVAPDTTISAAQAGRDVRALGLLSAPWPLVVTVSDTAAALLGLASLPAATLASLVATGVTSLIATDTAPILDAAQTSAFETAGLSLSLKPQVTTRVVLSDTGAALLTLFDNPTVNGFSSLSIASIVSTTDITLDAAQTDVVTISHELSVTATAGHTVTYEFADGSRSSNTYGDGGAVTRSENWNADGTISYIAYEAIVNQPYSYYYVYYDANGNPSSAYYSNGMQAYWTYDAGQSYHVDFDNVTAQHYQYYTAYYDKNGAETSATYSNGMTATWTYNPDGTFQIAYAHVTGQDYQSYTQFFAANGAETSATYSNGMSATVTTNVDGSYQIAIADVPHRLYTSYTAYFAANGQELSATYSDGMTATWSYNSDNSYRITFTGVTHQAYSSYTESFTYDWSHASNSYFDGMTAIWAYNYDGSYQVDYTGVVGEAYTGYTAYFNANGDETSATYSDGATETWTVQPDGSNTGVFADTAAHIESLSQDDLINLGYSGVNQVQSVDGSLQFTVAQALAIEQAKLHIVVPQGDGAEVVDTPAGLALLAPADIDALAALGVSVACYLRGTRILTERGEIAIEDLAVGDLAVTASGAMRPVVWLGHRSLDTRRHPDPAAVWPVVVRADAFGPGLPRRDLWLSPGHNLASDGRLMPVAALVNGVSVQQVRAPSVEYWHVELDAHDIVLAEGLPAESYLDTGNRSAFANGGAFIDAHPDFAPKHWAETCLPLVREGPSVAKAKQRLLARLVEQGYRFDRDADIHVVVDGVRIEPMRLSQTRLAFILLEGGREIALRSKMFIPAHMSAESTDVRELGLCVGRLLIDGVALRLDDDGICASGWHEAEFFDGRLSHRWTKGATPVLAGARVLIVDLAGAGCYRRDFHDDAAVQFG